MTAESSVGEGRYARVVAGAGPACLFTTITLAARAYQQRTATIRRGHRRPGPGTRSDTDPQPTALPDSLLDRQGEIR